MQTSRWRVRRMRGDRNEAVTAVQRTLVSAFALLLLPPAPADAQQATDPPGSVFTAATLRPGGIGGDLALIAGGRGGWFAHDRLSIGAGGYGLITGVETSYNDSVPDEKLDVGYGGLELEYTHPASGIVHYSLSLLLGGGTANYESDESSGPSDSFFLWEPGLHVAVDISTNHRLSAGLLYRGVAGLKLAGFEEDDLLGFSIDLALRYFFF